jgi:proteasome alpha subunit
MQIMAPDGMGYDRVVTVFSPDGRLFQVQYAMEAVKRGATVIAIKAKDGVAMIADKKVLHNLILARSIEKIYEVDHHVGAATIGLVADGRKLIEQSRLQAQRHRLSFDEAPSVKQMVFDVSSYMQIFTQYGGIRPFGVTVLMAGYDDEPKIYEIDPSGTPTEWSATAVGEGRAEVMKVLDSKYEANMKLPHAFTLGLNALENFLKEKFSVKRVEAAEITKKGFRKLSTEELEEMTSGKN